MTKRIPIEEKIAAVAMHLAGLRQIDVSILFEERFSGQAVALWVQNDAIAERAVKVLAQACAEHGTTIATNPMMIERHARLSRRAVKASASMTPEARSERATKAGVTRRANRLNGYRQQLQQHFQE